MYLTACSSLFRTSAYSSPSAMWTLLHWENSPTLHYCHLRPSAAYTRRRCLSLPSARANFSLGRSGARVMGSLGGSLLALNPALKAMQVCVCMCVCVYTLYLLACLSFFCTSIESAHTLLLQLQESGWGCCKQCMALPWSSTLGASRMPCQILSTVAP